MTLLSVAVIAGKNPLAVEYTCDPEFPAVTGVPSPQLMVTLPELMVPVLDVQLPLAFTVRGTKPASGVTLKMQLTGFVTFTI